MRQKVCRRSRSTQALAKYVRLREKCVVLDDDIKRLDKLIAVSDLTDVLAALVAKKGS